MRLGMSVRSGAVNIPELRSTRAVVAAAHSIMLGKHITLRLA